MLITMILLIAVSLAALHYKYTAKSTLAELYQYQTICNQKSETIAGWERQHKQLSEETSSLRKRYTENIRGLLDRIATLESENAVHLTTQQSLESKLQNYANVYHQMCKGKDARIAELRKELLILRWSQPASVTPLSPGSYKQAKDSEPSHTNAQQANSQSDLERLSQGTKTLIELYMKLSDQLEKISSDVYKLTMTSSSSTPAETQPLSSVASHTTVESQEQKPLFVRTAQEIWGDMSTPKVASSLD